MTILGILLIFLSFPLLIGYYMGGRKNIMWRNLGFTMSIIGLLIAVLGGGA